MFRLAHISDVHLGPLPAIRRRDLVSKRITGYVNWQRNRSRTHDGAVLPRLLDSLNSYSPDYLAITGDLINLGLDIEIAAARQWLQTLGEPADVGIVCGNHDAYVPGALAKALAAWHPWLVGDAGSPVLSSAGFPVLRRRGDLSIIACNSARASLPFLATGYFRQQQATALKEMLAEEGRRGQCRVVLIHHPPFAGATVYSKRLVGAGRFRKAVEASGAELVLHGHTHVASRIEIPGRDGPVPVIGVPAAGETGLGKRPAARFNLFDFERASGSTSPARFAIEWRQIGFAGPATAADTLAHIQLA